MKILQNAAFEVGNLPDKECSMVTLASVLQILKDENPSVYRHYFSKVYKDVDRFTDYRYPLYVLASSLLFFKHNSKWAITQPSMMNTLAFTSAFEEAGSPLFFVEKGLLEACDNTDLPKDFKLSSIRLPYMAMLFILPHNSLQHHSGQYAPYITICRIEKGRNFCAMVAEDIEELAGQAGVKISDTIYKQDNGDFSLNETIWFIHTVFPETARAITVKTTEADLQKEFDRTDREREFLAALDPKRTDAKDAKYFLRITRIAFNLIFAMEARPQLVERERKLKPVKNDRERFFWSPNTIGAKFQYKFTGGEKGTHASPRFHWRRGHFKKVNIGKVANPYMCVCGHSKKKHYFEPVGKLSEVSDTGTTNFCQVADCKCRHYKQQPFEYEDYRIDWFEPVQVNLKVGE